MRSTEIGEDLVVVRRKPQAHDVAIVGVSLTLDEPGTLAAIDEIDCGVVSDQKTAGHLADSWPDWGVCPAEPVARPGARGDGRGRPCPSPVWR